MHFSMWAENTEETCSFDFAIRFVKEKVTLNINLSYTDTRGAMVN